MRNKRSHDMVDATPDGIRLQNDAYRELIAALPHVLESGPVVSRVRNVWLTFADEPVSVASIIGLRKSTEIVVSANVGTDQLIIEQYWNEAPGVFALQETSRIRRASRARMAITDGPLDSSIPTEKHDSIKAVTHALIIALHVAKNDLGNGLSCASHYTSDGDVELETRISPPLLASELRGLMGVMEQYGVKNMRLIPRDRMVVLSLRL